MRLLLFITMLVSFKGYAQCKSYTLSSRGDTLNCIDRNDKKQGKWVVKVPGVRGEPGYDEEGIYKNGKKEGTWRVYTSMGDVFAIENYRWGNKDGRSQYFNIAGIIREESWKAVNPENPYDTIEVPDPVNPSKVEVKVVKIEGTAVKHGKWKYFDAASGSIAKTESYFLDKLEDPNSFYLPGIKSDTTNNKTVKAAEKPKPKEVLDFEKKVGKKKIKVIDGRTY